MEIKNAILHIIKSDGSPSVYSERELDIDSDVCEDFINKHVKKLWNSPTVREAVFNTDSSVYQALKGYINREVDFKDLSFTLGKRLSEIVNRYDDIPPSDFMIVRFDVKYDQFLAMFKFNYNECFTHETGGESNNLVKCRTVLPSSGGKVEAACLIPFSPMLVKVIEESRNIDGEAVSYFSQLFLECETNLSRKEVAQIISEVTNEFVHEYFDGDIKTHALVKTAMTEEAEEAEGIVSMDNVAARVFEDESLKHNFVHTLREAGIVEDIPLGAKFVKQQFGVQRFKANNGIDIKFPAELIADEGQMEIEPHSDSSVTLTFKRLRVRD